MPSRYNFFQLPVFRIQPNNAHRVAIEHLPLNPAPRRIFSSHLHRLAAALQDFNIFTTVALARRHHANTSVSMVLVVMLNEAIKPMLGLLKAFKSIPRVQVIASVLERSKEWLAVGVVAANPWAAMRKRDSGPAEQRQRLAGLHARAVVRMHV